MNTKTIGDITEAAVLAALVRSGRRVLKPWGDNARYDLALDEDGVLVRIRCKTGAMGNGVISFRTCSSYRHRGRKAKSYRDDADLFGVFCQANGKVYLIPVKDVCETHCHLRVTPPLNKQKAHIRWAADYELQ